MAGVLREDVEADPLQGGRVVGEPATDTGAFFETVGVESLSGAPAHVAQEGGDVFCRCSVSDSSSRDDARRSGVDRWVVNVPVAPGVRDSLAQESPDEPALFHVEEMAQQFDGRPSAGQS